MLSSFGFPLFLTNIRGWQLIIIVMVLIVFMVIPGLLGFRLGRKIPRHRQKNK